jgi:hypothetical protein
MNGTALKEASSISRSTLIGAEWKIKAIATMMATATPTRGATREARSEGVNVIYFMNGSASPPAPISPRQTFLPLDIDLSIRAKSGAPRERPPQWRPFAFQRG